MTEPQQPVEKITKLTPEQEKMLDEVREEWMGHGLSTQPANRAEAEEGVRDAYRASGLNPPQHFIWVKSPYAGSLALGIVPQAIDAAMRVVEEAVTNEVNDIQKRGRINNLGIDETAEREWWRNSTYGQHSAGYYAYLDAMERIGVKGLEPIHGSMKVAKNVGWWWPAEEFVIITERPSAIHRDQQMRLHHETGPALVYPDGFGIYVWHGTKVPKSLIQGKWDVKQILQEANTEIRRCAIEKMGWDVFVKEAKLKQVGKDQDDPGNPGHALALYDVPDQIFGTAIRILICDNATPERDGTRRRFGLTVPATMPDAVSGAAWTFNLTRDEYVDLQRAT